MTTQSKVTQAQQASFSNFFDKKEEVYQFLPVLGYDCWEMDSGNIAKLYVGTQPDSSDKNRGGIIPMTYSLNPDLIPLLKRVESFPAQIECLVTSVVGTKNKSTNTITNLKVNTI